MKFLSILTVLTGSLVAASPAANLEARATTSFAITGFTASCTTTPLQCTYSATFTTVPGGVVITATHVRTGASTFPAASGFWTTSNPLYHVYIQPASSTAKRIVFQDQSGSSTVTFEHISANTNWPIVGGVQSYTGPTSFTAPGSS